MDSWPEQDRRRKEPWQVEVDKKLFELNKNQRCLKEGFDKFQETYGELLKDTLESRARKAKLWEAAVTKLVTGGIWAAVIFLLLAAYKAFIGNLRSML